MCLKCKSLQDVQEIDESLQVLHVELHSCKIKLDIFTLANFCAGNRKILILTITGFINLIELS
jgi:hypothetical protein